MVYLPKKWIFVLFTLLFVFPKLAFGQGVIPGDIDTDGDVDIFDYNLLIENFGVTNCGNIADIDGDCKVDIFDYNILLENFGKTTATPTPTTKPTISPPPPQGKGIWISPEELSSLPTSGNAWNNLLSAANNLPGANAQGGHGSTHDTYTMAAALVAARLNDNNRRRIVADEIIEAVNNKVENDGNSLSLTRTLSGYIIAADLIDLRTFDPAADAKFRNWLEYVVYQLKLDGSTQIDKHYKANNHGTQAAVVRFAADIYLGNMSDFRQGVEAFKKWLGMPNSESRSFNWGSLCWQSNPGKPVGINPKGATLNIAGAPRNVDGVLPDEQRRAGCPSGWPPAKENYVYGGLQGVVAQAVILGRNGYPDVWDWQDRAILRAFKWLYEEINYPASGDDLFLLPVIDRVYGTNYWGGAKVDYGKQVGWTDWTHGR